MKSFPMAIVLVGVLALLSSGCRTFQAGNPVHEDYAKSLIPDQTNYDEIISELGPPTQLLDGTRLVAYRWNTHVGRFYIRPAFTYTSEDLPFTYTSGDLRIRCHALCLQFDREGRFQLHQYFVNAQPDTLREQLEDWAQSQQMSPGS